MTYREIARLRTESHDGRRLPQEEKVLKEADLIGIIAEGEFARKYGLDLSFEKAIRVDPGYDFVLPDGTKVDIKATTRYNGNLIVAIEKKRAYTTDAFVLAVVDIDNEKAQFVGWATVDTVRQAEVRDFKYGAYPVHFVSRNKLRPMEELVRA